jgi:hypothetical protein
MRHANSLILVFIMAIIFLSGCNKTDEPPEFQPTYDDNATLEEFAKDSPPQEPKTPEPEQAPPAPEEPEPIEGEMDIKGYVEKTLPVLDMEVDVDMKTTGELKYEIDKHGILRGSGEGNLAVTLYSDIGIAKCEGTKDIPLKFSVTGAYDRKSGEAVLKSHDITPSKDKMILNCPSEYAGDLTYDLNVPVLFFVHDGNEGKFVLKLKDPGTITMKIKHPVPDWEMDLEADWEFKISPKSGFDFDVDIKENFVNVTQGGTATPLVTVKKTRGTAKDVKLTVTQWPVLKAFITNTVVTPTESTTLTIETSCDTPADNYLFTVRGETAGTFQTSQDAVTLTVVKNPSCP